MPNDDKIKLDLPSQRRRGKKKKRITLGDDDLLKLREESLKSSYPELADNIQGEPTTPSMPAAADDSDSGSDEVANDEVVETNDKEKVKEAKPEKVTSSKKKAKAKSSESARPSGGSTSTACYKETVERVRLVCTLVKEKQYIFVDQALDTYHDYQQKKGQLDLSNVPSKTERNFEGSSEREFLQCSIDRNQQAKIDSYLLGIPKYELVSRSIDHYFKVLKRKKLIPDQIVDLLGI